jgi:MFS transporter, DHA2 family, glioxin efflux transporter
MDPIGAALVIGGIITYTLAVQYGGQTKPWNSGTVIGLLVAFVVIVVAFVIWEYFQGERAIFVPRLMKDRNIWVNSLFGFSFGGSYFIAVYYLPIYFQSVKDVSPIMSGVRNLPLIITVSFAIVISSVSISATGYAAPIMVAGAAFSTVGSGLLYTLDINSSTGKWIGFQILGGLGWGGAFQVPLIIAQGTAKPSDMSTATAIILCKLLPTLSL